MSGTYSKRSPGWQFNASHNAAIESVVIRFPARRCISVSRRNATTVNQTMVVISCIVHGSLAAAKKRKLISENVAAGAEIPKKTKAKKERIALTRE